jgi:hypothetical protein
LLFGENPNKAFSRAVLFNLAYTAVAISLVLVGEMIRVSDPEFRRRAGYVALSSRAEWLLRGGLLLYAIQNIIVTVLVVSESRLIAGIMRYEPRRADLAVLTTLGNIQILRNSYAISIACLGLVLFVFAGHQLDLLVACLASIGLLVFWRPTRARWAAVFARASSRYPEISTSPW